MPCLRSLEYSKVHFPNTVRELFLRCAEHAVNLPVKGWAQVSFAHVRILAAKVELDTVGRAAVAATGC